ncbi:hypothetical protein PILCRDRAFT_15382 [Piloderma croceum F 1598]|uniref:hAT-like transposase RNase-H fold domain-containing protein n=1 Tax=Piloderma croceum (strain F 1598) TaxID=765440 RepID=A0A0C3F001_PILCF|nr:hypothetical protein PILCRDRAFT_15382 [Piloderma croceum F 1598]
MSATTLETLANTPKFVPVKKGIEKGLEKLHKWYMATDQTDIYFICLALEPSVKLEYAKQKWDKLSYDNGIATLEKAFDTYMYHPHHFPRNPHLLRALLLNRKVSRCPSFRQPFVAALNPSV